jgi:hypothetical protein
VDSGVDKPQRELAAANSPEKVRVKYFQRLECDLEGFLTLRQGALDVLCIPRSAVNFPKHSREYLMDKDLNRTYAYGTTKRSYLEKTYIQVSTINVINSIKYLQTAVSYEDILRKQLHVELSMGCRWPAHLSLPAGSEVLHEGESNRKMC